MFKYEKWLGAGLGWALTGNPLGGVLGFLAGAMMGKDRNRSQKATGITEFEANVIVLSSHLIKIDGKVTLDEITFVKDFLSQHFDEKYSSERTQAINHCLNHEYSLNTACDQIRMYTEHGTHVQVVHFLFELAQCDGAMNEREEYFIFRIAGYLNVNDVDYKKIKEQHAHRQDSAYDVLGVRNDASLTEIRNAYRKLVLKYHPDRNRDLDEEGKKRLGQRLQQVKDAYEKVKELRRNG